ncbi:glycosyltransferase [uncultured Nonlabens sp.]|uniref:glycosyltransferase n=1 Tax=uncultured Nonlabens sp. TaxID=859306 RepID=UPI00260B1D05|nr:glycosyltransferase [uncultured Nonlabens sp.]
MLYVPTLEGGGAEKVFVHLANYFVSQDYKVIYTYAYGDTYKELMDSRIQLKHSIKKKPSTNKKINLIYRFLLMPFFLFKLLKVEKPDFFITSVLEANMLGSMIHRLSFSKSKLIVRQAGILAGETHPKKLSFLLRMAFNHSNIIIANSYDTKKSINLFLKKKEKKEIKVIGNPIYQANKTVYPKNDLRPYIITVGRLEQQKDQHTLIKAFKIVISNYDIRLKILGSGSYKESLKTLVKQLDLNEKVDFIEFQKNPEPFYANAQLFVISSIFEAFGNVIVEAMSHGLPVVSTNCPGGPKFILNKSKLGELCEVKNPQAMATAILKVLNNPEKYPKEAIINRAKDFSLEKIGEEYLDLITNS